MDVVSAWLLFPAVALLVCAGHGLLVEWATGARLPGALLVPVGLAGLVCTSQLTTYWDFSARATVPLVVAATVAGLLLGRERVTTARPQPWALGAALAVFAAFAAPVVFSGEATFAGYTILGDTAIHFIGSDALLQSGRDFSGLPASSYENALVAYYGSNGYPSGGPTAVGAVTSLVGVDVAWTFQPFLATMAAATALAIWALTADVLASPALRGIVSFLGGQPALVFAYALQGSVKELGSAFALALVAALLPVFARHAAESARRAVPLSVVAAAWLGMAGLAAAAWLVPFALAALVGAGVVQRRPPVASLLGAVAAALAITSLLGFQALVDVRSYVEVAGGVLTAQQELGNLVRPLDKLQALGIWLVGDYRVPPAGDNFVRTYLLLGAALACGILGASWVVRCRAWPVIAYAAVAVAGAAYVIVRGSPWADAKALMIASPALVLIVLLGAASVLESGRRLAGAGLMTVLAAGILLSNALAYANVSLAPRDRLLELQRAARQAGTGPTLVTEFEEFAKHFARGAAPDGPTIGFVRRTLVVASGRQAPPAATTVDLDDLAPSYLEGFTAILLRRGPSTSRPPTGWVLVHRGRYYETWRRSPGAADVLGRVPAGSGGAAAGQPPCDQVEQLARLARAADGTLVAATRPVPSVASAAEQQLPSGWATGASHPGLIRTSGAGRLSVGVTVPATATYQVWIEGSFGRRLDVRVDGRTIASLAAKLNGLGVGEPAGTVRLAQGTHALELIAARAGLRPGSGRDGLLGRVVLEPVDATAGLQREDPRRWRRLCDRPVDWVEAVA